MTVGITSIPATIAISRKLRRVCTAILFIFAPSHIFVYPNLFVLMGARMNWLVLSQFFRSHSEPVVRGTGIARTDNADIEIVCQLHAWLIRLLISCSVNKFELASAPPTLLV